MTTGDFNILDILEVVEFLVNSFREATYICLASLVLLVRTFNLIHPSGALTRFYSSVL
jgi:hypothetical protein